MVMMLLLLLVVVVVHVLHIRLLVLVHLLLEVGLLVLVHLLQIRLLAVLLLLDLLLVVGSSRSGRGRGGSSRDWDTELGRGLIPELLLLLALCTDRRQQEQTTCE